MLPNGWDALSARLAVVTEFVEAPAPEINRVPIPEATGAETEDHVAISLDGVSILMGHAFPVGDGPALSLATSDASGSAVAVRKTWQPLASGGAVLEESVSLVELDPLWATLPRQARAESTALRNWRTAAVQRVPEDRPVEIAQVSYQPTGLAIDFETTPSCSGGVCTLQMGKTYYVHTSYYMGPGPIVFEPGCTLKLTNNAYVLVYGPLTFQNTLQAPVFTSFRDDAFGEDIDGFPGSIPTNHANPSLWVYYPNFSTTVQSARFRYAQTAIRYEANSTVNHYLNDSLIERCGTAVYVGNYVRLYTSGLEKNLVTTDFQGPGWHSGTMTQAPFFSERSFAGQNNGDGTPTVADTMGAIGPVEFVEVTSGGKLALFSRATGARLQEQALAAFFGVPEVADPRVWYGNMSPVAGPRWIATGMYSAGKQLLVKVSLTPSPSLESNWRPTCVIDIPAVGSETIDFPTLGVDANGIYVSVQRRLSLQHIAYHIQAFKKPDVYTDPHYCSVRPSLLQVSASDLNAWCIQPAFNFDNPPLGGNAWFIAKGPPNGVEGGLIQYRRGSWNGASFTLVGTGTWDAAAGAYRDYYDIPQSGTPPFVAPQTVSLSDMGSRLMMAVIRNDSLWTCHHVGLHSSGTHSGGTADRSGAQLLNFQVSSGALTYVSRERIYDSAGSNPYWYHFPSLNVNGSGDLVVGFSGSRTTEYIGAFFRGRKANGTWMVRPNLVQAGRTTYAGNRWGDYSATTIDPTDGSFWTVQEYADPVSNETWGTWIVQIVRY